MWLSRQTRSDEKADVTREKHVGKSERDAAEELVDEKRDWYRSMASTAHYWLRIVEICSTSRQKLCENWNF